MGIGRVLEKLVEGCLENDDEDGAGTAVPSDAPFPERTGDDTGNVLLTVPAVFEAEVASAPVSLTCFCFSISFLARLIRLTQSSASSGVSALT